MTTTSAFEAIPTNLLYLTVRNAFAEAAQLADVDLAYARNNLEAFLAGDESTSALVYVDTVVQPLVAELERRGAWDPAVVPANVLEASENAARRFVEVAAEIYKLTVGPEGAAASASGALVDLFAAATQGLIELYEEYRANTLATGESDTVELREYIVHVITPIYSELMKTPDVMKLEIMVTGAEVVQRIATVVAGAMLLELASVDLFSA